MTITYEKGGEIGSLGGRIFKEFAANITHFSHHHDISSGHSYLHFTLIQNIFNIS